MLSVGLDIGHFSIKVALADISGGRPVLRMVLSVPLSIEGSDNRDEVVATVIDRLFKEHNLPRDHVVAALNDEESYVRDLTIPLTQLDQVIQTLPYTLEPELPCALDDVLIDHHVIDVGDDESHVLAVAGRRRAIRNKISLIERSKISPQVLDSNPAALFNFAATVADAEGVDSFMVIDVGTRTADLLYGQDRSLQFVRSIKILAAQDQKSEQNPDEDAGSYSDLGDVRWKRLIQEIKRTLMTRAGGQSPEVVYLAGGLTLQAGVIEHMAQDLDVDVRLLDPRALSTEVTIEPEVASAAAVAVGLALHPWKEKIVDMDFRREEFVVEPALVAVKTPLILSLVLLLLLCLGGMVDSVMRARFLEQEVMAGLDVFDQSAYWHVYAPEVDAKDVHKIKFPRSIYQHFKKDWNKISSEGDVGIVRSTSITRIWQDFENALVDKSGEDKTKFQILNLSIDEGGVRVVFKIKSQQQASTLFRHLANLEQFEALKKMGDVRTLKDEPGFTYTQTLKRKQS